MTAEERSGRDGASRSREGLGPATLDEALAGSPLTALVSDLHVYGCSQSIFHETLEGTFVLHVDHTAAGTAQLTGRHREVSGSFGEGPPPGERIGVVDFEWSASGSRRGHELSIKLTPRPGCEPNTARPSSKRPVECPSGYPPVSLRCSAARFGELELETVEPVEGLAADAAVLRCRSVSRLDATYGLLFFLTEPFVLAPAPGARIVHARGNHLIDDHL